MFSKDFYSDLRWGVAYFTIFYYIFKIEKLEYVLDDHDDRLNDHDDRLDDHDDRLDDHDEDNEKTQIN